MQAYWGQHALPKNGFARYLDRLRDALYELVPTFGQQAKQRHTEVRYGSDSFPVPMCHHIRVGRSKSLTGKVCYGHHAGKRSGSFGVKIIATADVLSLAGATSTLTARRIRVVCATWPPTYQLAACSVPTTLTPTPTTPTKESSPELPTAHAPPPKQ